MEFSPVFSTTAVLFVIPWLILWFTGKLSIGKMILLLFVFDIVLTLEAALESNVIEVYVLHVVTIPGFFGLIYMDIMAEHKTNFSCFICGKSIATSEPTESVKKMFGGRYRAFLVHSACIGLDHNQRKAFSSRIFRKGIPE